MKIKASKVFTDGHFLHDQVIAIHNQRIESITPANIGTSFDLDFGADTFIIPGMIDIHIHGANGADVMDATPAALETIANTLAEEGVTGFLATTMSESAPKIVAALKNIASYLRGAAKPLGAEILGVHLEGPFLSSQHMGAQCGEFLLNPEAKILAAWQKESGHLIKLMTLAPELQGALPFIKTANDLGIVVSLGHTSASFDETIAGIDAGARSATHLFNAMTGVHHRNPGAAAAILYDDRIHAELIADGHHVVPSMLKLAAKCKGLDKLMLVTDAMRAKCLKNGEYDLGGQVVTVKDGEARLQKNGVLAGSVLRLNGALRNFVKFTESSLEECIPMVSATPAKLLNMHDTLGSLTPSLKANLVVLNSNLDVLCTIREGQIIYQRS